MNTPERRVRSIALRQHGAITRRQALAAGFTDDRLVRRVERGEWLRLERGVYLVFGDPGPATRLMAAVAALPAVISHGSAAETHGLRASSRGQPEVTVPHRFTNKFAGVVVHESTDLDAGQIVEIDGLPVTTPSRTIFDLAKRLGHHRLQRVIDDAIVRRLTSVEDLQDLLASIGRRGRPGTANMRRLLATMTESYVAPESELERRLIDLLASAGLPAPVLQMRLPWRSHVDGRVDAAYPDHRLIIECDGRRWHTAAESFERDRRRDNLAQLAGWRVLRFTWADVNERPMETVHQVIAARDRFPS